jgi:hypothetical protein
VSEWGTYIRSALQTKVLCLKTDEHQPCHVIEPKLLSHLISFNLAVTSVAHITRLFKVIMSQAGAPDENTLLTYVNEVWFKTFSQAPYTSIWMIEYLLGKTDLSYEEILEDPGILHKTLEDEPLRFEYEDEFKYISSRPGRCTSFAIQVVRDLEETADERGHRDRFEFEFFELGFHRVARCKKTGIMIDSSSSHGAFILKEGAWETFTGLAKWEWNPGNSRFEKSSTSGSVRLLHW